MKGKYPGRVIFWLSALVLLAVIAAACAPAATAPTATPTKAAASAVATTSAPAQPTATTAPPKPTPTAAVTKVKIAKSFSGPGNVALFIAQQEGYFKAEGLDAELLQVPGTAGLAALAAGELLVSDASTSAMNAAMEGAPFRVVFTGTRLQSYVWLRDPYKKASDLVGKKFGCSSPGDSACLVAQNVLKKWGLEDITKVTWVGVGSDNDRLAALRAGAVDAGYVTNVQHNVLLPLDGKGFTFLGDAGQEIRMGTGGLATSTVTIRSQKDLLQKVLRAVVKAQRFVMDPTKAEKSTDYLTEWSKQDRSAAEVVVKDYILGKGILWKDGLMSDEALKTTIAFSREALKITAEFQADQLFDTSFAKAAAQEMDSKGWKP